MSASKKNVPYCQVSSQPNVIYYPNKATRETKMCCNYSGEVLKVFAQPSYKVEECEKCGTEVKFYKNTIHCDDCGRHHAANVTICNKCKQCVGGRSVMKLNCTVCNRNIHSVGISEDCGLGRICGRCTNPETFICSGCRRGTSGKAKTSVTTFFSKFCVRVEELWG